jgi:hypothetical protein
MADDFELVVGDFVDEVAVGSGMEGVSTNGISSSGRLYLFRKITFNFDHFPIIYVYIYIPMTK